MPIDTHTSAAPSAQPSCSTEAEAFLKLCEALGIPATACAHLEGTRIAAELAAAQASLAFVLASGLPMTRDGKYRYHGVREPVWHDTQLAAIQAAMQDFGFTAAPMPSTSD